MSDNTTDLLIMPGTATDFCLAACIGTDPDALAAVMVDAGITDDTTACITADVMVRYRARVSGGLAYEVSGYEVSVPEVAQVIARDITAHDIDHITLDVRHVADVSAGLWAWAVAVQAAAHRDYDDVSYGPGPAALAAYIRGRGRGPHDHQDYVDHAYIAVYNAAGWPERERVDRTDPAVVGQAHTMWLYPGSLRDRLPTTYDLGTTNRTITSAMVKDELRELLTEVSDEYPEYTAVMLDAMDDGVMDGYTTMNRMLTAGWVSLSDDDRDEHDWYNRRVRSLLQEWDEEHVVRLRPFDDYTTYSRRALAAKMTAPR